MKVEFTYVDRECVFEYIPEEDGYELNPVPVLKALIGLFEATSSYGTLNMTMKSKEDNTEL